MATKKTDAPTIDIASLNVWQRLMMARIEFLSGGAKKSGKNLHAEFTYFELVDICLLYTSPSPRDRQKSRMPSSA